MIPKKLKPLPSALTVASPSQNASEIESAPTKRPAGKNLTKRAPRTPRIKSGPSPENRELLRDNGPTHPRPTVAGDGKPAEALEVHFAAYHPHAKTVSLCGEFNNWSATATPMTPLADGHWQATVALPAGRYEYKFWADGEWLPDLQAQEQVLNSYGSLNSVRQVGI